jgi:pilus assembly protein Flp/PilA
LVDYPEEPAIQGQKQVLSIMKSLILTFFKNESGATAIEYGLIAAGIALAIIAAVQGVGTQLSNNFGSISTSLK